MDKIIQLGMFSRDELIQLRRDLDLSYTHHTNGILHVYEKSSDLEHAIENGKWMQRWGVLKDRLSADDVVRRFPELEPLQHSIAGATYTQSDEHGDAFEFTQALMDRCIQQGVEFHWDCHIDSLQTRGGEYNAIDHVLYHDAKGSRQRIQADHYIVAMGSYTPLLLESIGSYAPIYPAKGYSATYRILDGQRIPSLSITDEQRKVVFSRLNDTLRVAGTAEFNGWDTQLNWERTRALDNATRHWFGDAVDYSNPSYWTGLRPATPNNIPLIGPWKHYTNLWLNSGHGTLGWTHACGSAKSLANQFSNHPQKYPWILKP